MNEHDQPVDFKSFVGGLIATAAMIMGEMEAQPGSERRDEAKRGEQAEESEESPGTGGEEEPRSDPDTLQTGLANARRLIEVLSMLDEKTRGNLDPGERELLQSGLTDLRLQYVRLSRRSGRSAEEQGTSK